MMDSSAEQRHQQERTRTRFVYQDDQEMEKPFNWQQLGRLLQYVKPYKRQLLPLIILMMIVGTITKLSIPLLVGVLIDHALLDGDGNLLAIIVVVMALMYGVQWIASYYRIKISNIIGQRIIYDLRFQLFQHIQQLSFRFFDKRPAGSVLVRVTNDVNSMQELFSNGVINLLIDMVQLIGIIFILLIIQPQLAIAVMITVPIMFFISGRLRRRIRRSWQGVRTSQTRINSHLNESIQGIRVTQAFAQEKENMNYFDHMNTFNRKSWNHAIKMNTLFTPIIELASALGTAILFWYGVRLIEADALTLGNLVTFSILVGFFWEPINRLGQMYTQLLMAMASSERIFEFMDEEPSVGEKANAIEQPAVEGYIEFDHIVFDYEPGRHALNGVSFNAKPGESIALVGHTGSGKSTIINLLSRFYDPISGAVRIDGRDIRDVKLESLRQQVGIVLQDTFIFSGTIRDNIRFGRLEATDEEVEAVAKAVYAHDFITELPQQYETEVEERGGMLSMGQRQLLSFARALLADPRILILDEATASIDTETEVKIQLALKTLLQGRNSFIVAHRLSTVRHADQIIVLDHGMIKEQGNHDELMDQKGIYYGLIQSQYKFLDQSI